MIWELINQWMELLINHELSYCQLLYHVSFELLVSLVHIGSEALEQGYSVGCLSWLQCWSCRLVLWSFCLRACPSWSLLQFFSLSSYRVASWNLRVFCEGVAWKIELRVCLRRLSFLWKDFPLFILVYILRCNLQCKRFVWFQKWLIVQVGRWAFSQRLARALIPKEFSGNLVDTALWAKKWEETLHKNISPRLTMAERQRPIILEVIVSLHDDLQNWWTRTSKYIFHPCNDVLAVEALSVPAKRVFRIWNVYLLSLHLDKVG